MRLEIEFGLYNEDFLRILKWYSLAFKDKKGCAEDELLYSKISILHDDMKKLDKEDGH